MLAFPKYAAKNYFRDFLLYFREKSTEIKIISIQNVKYGGDRIILIKCTLLYWVWDTFLNMKK